MIEDLPPVDVESITTGYGPHTAVPRLLFIAERSDDDALKLDALRAAHDVLKQGDNTRVYTSVVEKIAGRLGASHEMDKEWVHEVDKRAAKKQEVLDAELNGYKTNMIKESIRMGHNDLGDFYHARGDLNAAFKCYVRTRDYCTTPRHVVNMCLNVIRVSVESENFAQVQNYVAKATQVPDVEEPMVAAKLACAGGLAAIEARKYKLAAEKFTQLTVEVASGYDEVIGAVDIATYGGLCALASFDRSELKTHVLENPTFRTAMEVTPEVRECVEDFYNSRYSSLFDSLERLRPQLQLDLHLHDHVESLYDCIRRRSLIQYCTPFSVVDLRKMADAFRVDDVLAMEREVGALIADDKIAVRIDSQRKILHKTKVDERAATYEDALEAGRLFTKGVHAMLLRGSLIRNECTVKGAPVSRRGGFHGGGWGGGPGGGDDGDGGGPGGDGGLFRGFGRGGGFGGEGLMHGGEGSGHVSRGGMSRGGGTGRFGRYGGASRASASERDGGGDQIMIEGGSDDDE